MSDMENNKTKNLKKSSDSSLNNTDGLEQKPNSSTQKAEIGYPVDLSISNVDPSLTLTSNPPIQLQTPTDSFTTLYDEFNNTIQEKGFEETIRFSTDFKPNEINLKVDSKSFTVSGNAQSDQEPKSTTITSHNFYHFREFNRPIRNVEMEVGRGVAKVYGEFADF